MTPDHALRTGRLVATVVLTAVLAGCSTLSQEEVEELRRELDFMSESVIAKLVETRPELQQPLAESPGFAVADMKVTKIPVFGGGGGNGVIVDRRSGEKTYIKVSRFEVGGGMGLQSFKAIVLFHDAELLERAMAGFWHVDAGAEVGAGEKSADGSVSSVARGYQVFRLAEGGAIATVTVRTIRARPFLE